MGLWHEGNGGIMIHWCAYERYKWNQSYKEKWFNKIENYRDNCHGFTVLNVYDGMLPNPEPSITYPFWYGIHDFKQIFLSP